VSKQYLRTKEAADLLGLSVDTIRNWINRKNDPLPAIKAGRDWLIDRRDLDEFLQRNKNIQQEDEP
jgi:excisionase family DNA binding protein